MRWQFIHVRPVAVALGAVLFVQAGCAPSRSVRPGGGPGAPPLPAGAPVDFSAPLDASQERRAEALAHYGTGVALELSRGLDAAIEHYQTSLELDPQNTRLAIRLANVLIGRREFAEARALLESAVRAAPDNADAWMWLGMTYRANEKDLPRAIDALRRALKLDPTHAAAVPALVDLYFEAGDRREAVRILENAWRQPSPDARYWMRIGDLYLAALKKLPADQALIDPQRPIQAFEKALSLDPGDLQVLARLATACENAGQPERAAAFYEQILAQRPDELGIRLKMAHAFLAAGNKEKATAQLEEIIKKNPLQFEVYNMLGDLYEELEQDEKALSNYRQSLVVKPEQVEPSLRIALLLLKKKQYQEALDALAEAKKRAPNVYQVAYVAGLVYSEQKDYARAVASFGEAETLARESSEPSRLEASFYFYYGAACERVGEIDRAAAQFRKALELDPNHHPSCNYLGYMWADKGINLEEARELIEKAVKLDPESGAYLDSLGWVLFKLGRTSEALPHLRRAAELVKDDPVVLEHLGDVLWQLGQREEALRHLRRAHELDPDNQTLTDKLQKLTVNQTAAPDS